MHIPHMCSYAKQNLERQRRKRLMAPTSEDRGEAYGRFDFSLDTLCIV